MIGEPYCAWCNQLGHAANEACALKYYHTQENAKSPATVVAATPSPADMAALAERIDSGFAIEGEGHFSPPLSRSQWRMIAAALRAAPLATAEPGVGQTSGIDVVKAHGLKTCLDETGLQITSELYKAINDLKGATPCLLAMIGSWGDTLDDADILDGLKRHNEMGECFIPVSVDLAASPAPHPEVKAGATVEEIAKWLHDETGHPDAYPNHTWPETERDDGQREGGFVKIVPLHGQAYFRDIARRLVARFSAPEVKAGNALEAYPSVEAMKAAVELEIHAALGSVQTVVIGQMIQKTIDAALRSLSGNAVAMREALKSTRPIIHDLSVTSRDPEYKDVLAKVDVALAAAPQAQEKKTNDE